MISMNKKLWSILLIFAILVTSFVPGVKAEAATEIKISEDQMFFHTDFKEEKNRKLYLTGVDESQVKWSVRNGKRLKKGTAGTWYKVDAKKVVKVSKNGSVRAVG